MDYVEYWGLMEKPFENTRDTRFFFPSENHAEALERMLYLTKDGNMNFGLLTGEIGCGKSLTKTVFERRLLSHQGFEVVSLENSSFPFKTIIYEIIAQLKRANRDYLDYDEYALVRDFKEAIAKVVIERNQKMVVLLDEAQQMDGQCLDRLKNITNINAEAENYITIFLIGQPELRQQVESLPQLDQRVSLKYHLRYLSVLGTSNYIRHRLRCAGTESDSVFPGSTVELIYQYTKGIPREINRICRLALDAGFAHQMKSVDTGLVQRIIEDFETQSRSGRDLLKPLVGVRPTREPSRGRAATAEECPAINARPGPDVSVCGYCGKKLEVDGGYLPNNKFVCKLCRQILHEEGFIE